MTRASFDGRCVVVTGAAGGLGRSIALRFAAEGARIAALDRDTAELAAFAAHCARERFDCLPIACDVTDPAACSNAIAATAARFGRIDVLVANAGISQRSPFAQTRLEVIRRVVDVNFYGAVHCTQAALPHLLASRGVIVAISSVAGFAPLIGRTGYAASKHALQGFFASLRTELAPRGVGVTIACPSFVDTGIERHALGADGSPARQPRRVTGAMASPDEVAHTVVEAARRRRPLALIGRTARLAWWVSRLAPSVYERMMAARLRGEFDTAAR